MIILFIPFIQAAGLFFMCAYMINDDKRIDDLRAFVLLLLAVISTSAGYLGLSVYIGTFTPKQTVLTDIVSFIFPAVIFSWLTFQILRNPNYKREFRHMSFLNQLIPVEGRSCHDK